MVGTLNTSIICKDSYLDMYVRCGWVSSDSHPLESFTGKSKINGTLATPDEHIHKSSVTYLLILKTQTAHLGYGNIVPFVGLKCAV